MQSKMIVCCYREQIVSQVLQQKLLLFLQTVALWDWLKPLLKNALNNMTVSTLNDWASFYTFVSVSLYFHI